MSATSKAPPSGRALATLALGALGVVYGDIGTSPLYALKECFSGAHGFPVSTENVLGILSLIFWSLNFVVTFKYLTIVMRADNRGEGGILALLALARPSGSLTTAGRLLVAVGLFGAALLYGDGIITPAISVLGAVEGLTVATPALSHWVVPVAFGIILALFAFQRRGTAGVGAVFGPVTAVWFVCIALLGIHGIVREPAVLQALNPWYAVDFFRREGTGGSPSWPRSFWWSPAARRSTPTWVTSAAARSGSPGSRWCCRRWCSTTSGRAPTCCTIPSAAKNPFYSLVPDWALYPMVAIATAAAVVASQALISGAFSLTRQAVQLGYCPRMSIVHTSSHPDRPDLHPHGQQHAHDRLPRAGGRLRHVEQPGGGLRRRRRHDHGDHEHPACRGGVEAVGVEPVGDGALTSVFLLVDLAFVGANLLKMPDGGWVPLVVAIIVYVLMSTWKKGRVRLEAIVQENTLPIDLFLQDIRRRKPLRVHGTAVFLTPHSNGAPPVLLHHLKHNQVLHEKVMLLSVVTEEIPQLDLDERVVCKELGESFYQVVARYGFMETPDVPGVLRLLARGDADGKPVAVKLPNTSYYLGRETLIVAERRPRTGPPPPAGSPTPPVASMARWRKKLFIFMARNAQSATAFFGIPPNRVVELGAQIQF